MDKKNYIQVPFKHLTITCDILEGFEKTNIIVDGEEFGDKCSRVTFNHDVLDPNPTLILRQDD